MIEIKNPNNKYPVIVQSMTLLLNWVGIDLQKYQPCEFICESMIGEFGFESSQGDNNTHNRHTRVRWFALAFRMFPIATKKIGEILTQLTYIKDGGNFDVANLLLSGFGKLTISIKKTRHTEYHTQ